MTQASKPTPGPWETFGTLIFKNGPDGGTICEMSALRVSRYVEHKRLAVGDPDFYEQMANRDLMAAAPALAQALEDIRRLIADDREPKDVEMLNLIDGVLKGAGLE